MLLVGPASRCFRIVLLNKTIKYQCTLYRPQTTFAKVMFSQVSVCPQGGGVRGRGGHSCHTCPLPCTPPWNANPLPCMPPAMHAPLPHMLLLPCMPPCHTCTPHHARPHATHARPPPLDMRAVRILLECIFVFLIHLRCLSNNRQ